MSLRPGPKSSSRHRTTVRPILIPIPPICFTSASTPSITSRARAFRISHTTPGGFVFSKGGLPLEATSGSIASGGCSLQFQWTSTKSTAPGLTLHGICTAGCWSSSSRPAAGGRSRDGGCSRPPAQTRAGTLLEPLDGFRKLRVHLPLQLGPNFLELRCQAFARCLPVDREVTRPVVGPAGVRRKQRGEADVPSIRSLKPSERVGTYMKLTIYRA